MKAKLIIFSKWQINLRQTKKNTDKAHKSKQRDYQLFLFTNFHQSRIMFRTKGYSSIVKAALKIQSH